MPIYEYRCSSCGRTFERFVRKVHERDEPKCPHCGDGQVERLPSVFAARSAPGPTPLPTGACPRCGDPSGPCSSSP